MEFYRYDEMVSDAGFRGQQVIITCSTLYLLKETPCGYWITDFKPESENEMQPVRQLHKWVSKTARKRHAYPTKAEAWLSYNRRKYRQHRLLKNQLRRIEVVLKAILQQGDDPPDRFGTQVVHMDPWSGELK